MGEHGIGTRISHRFKVLRYRYSRFTNRFNTIIRSGSNCLGILAFIAAVLCLVCLIVLAGYEHDHHQRLMLYRLIRACQITFIIKVIYNLVLRFRATARETRTVKWIVDIAVLLSLLPLIPHTPSISKSYWIYPKICPNFNHGSLSNYYCTRPSSRHLLRGCYHCLLNDLPDSL